MYRSDSFSLHFEELKRFMGVQYSTVLVLTCCVWCFRRTVLSVFDLFEKYSMYGTVPYITYVQYSVRTMRTENLCENC